MSLWDDLSPLVKRYLIVAAVLIVGVIGLRTCMTPKDDGQLPPRGLTR
jgi:hypothetical protein